MIEQIAHTDIFTVDAEYSKPNLAAIHIVREGNELAIVDTGTEHSIPNIERALRQLNSSWNDVRFIILTHIHLDHAGGAGHMMALANNAELIVHSRGARHMADPSKLIAGSVAVYGEEAFARLYGEIKPISSERMIVPEEGDSVSLAGRIFKFIDTPGHANHHFCIWDEKTKSMFTGDTMGVGYQALRSGATAYVMPSSTPVQFTPDKLHKSIDKIMSYQPAQVYLTHYGALAVTADWVAGLHEQIDAYTAITEKVANDTADEQARFQTELERKMLAYLRERAQLVVSDLADDVLTEWLQIDAQLNAMGLVAWWQQQLRE